MRVERTVQIAAPPEKVYEVVMDPSRLEDWVTIHDKLEGSPPARLRKGSKLTQSLKLAGRAFKVRWTVVENDPRKKVVWEGKGPVGSTARVEYRFAANGRGNTLLLHERVRPSRWCTGAARRPSGGPRDRSGARRFPQALEGTSRVTVNG